MKGGFDGLPIARRTTMCGSKPHAPSAVAAGGWQTKATRLDANRLPVQILRAIALVYESDGLRTLHITNRQVLATLVRFALDRNDPSALAVVKKATIAKHLGISEATVYRALGALENAGLIERERQRRTKAHLEVVGRIGFSAKLLQCIGITSPRLQTTVDVSAHSDEPAVSTGLASMSDVNKTIQSSTKKHPRPGPFLQIDGRAVPMDLAPLVNDQALRLSALFLLMRLARTAGHRLSDVVSSAGNALRPLQGRELFAYLKSLLDKPIDYGHVVRMRKLREDEVRAAAARATQEREQIAELVERYRGKRVSGPDGSTYEVDSASIVITDAYGRRSSLAHEQARAWLVEMDRVASGLAPAVIQPAQARERSTVVAPCLPCDATNLIRCKEALSEARIEELPAMSIAAAVPVSARQIQTRPSSCTAHIAIEQLRTLVRSRLGSERIRLQ